MLSSGGIKVFQSCFVRNSILQEEEERTGEKRLEKKGEWRLKVARGDIEEEGVEWSDGIAGKGLIGEEKD